MSPFLLSSDMSSHLFTLPYRPSRSFSFSILEAKSTFRNLLSAPGVFSIVKDDSASGCTNSIDVDDESTEFDIGYSTGVSVGLESVVEVGYMVV